jgi:predicted CopG family antitoxin
MRSRHTITLNEKAYHEISRLGKFGESYSELVLRLVQEVELKTTKERINRIE